jgi:hypothetical protein
MKRLLLFILISAVIGGGIWWLSREEGQSLLIEENMLDEVSEEPEFFTPSDALARSVITQVLSDQFADSSATYQVADLDHQGGPELIIGAVENIPDLSSRPATAAVYVVSLLDQEGAYERMGKLEYVEWLRGVPEVIKLADLDGDQHEEIIMALFYGGASSEAEGILKLNRSSKRLAWAQLRDQTGKQQDAIFIVGASAVYQNYFEVREDQIIEVFAQRLAGEDAFSCEATAYTWDGQFFAYNQQSSQNLLSQLGPDCRL